MYRLLIAFVLVACSTDPAPELEGFYRQTNPQPKIDSASLHLVDSDYIQEWTFDRVLRFEERGIYVIQSGELCLIASRCNVMNLVDLTSKVCPVDSEKKCSKYRLKGNQLQILDSARWVIFEKGSQ